MFHLEDVLHLHERERLLGVARQHPSVLLRRLLWALVLIVAPFFLIFRFISWGAPGMIVFLGLVLFGSAVAIRAVLLWNGRTLIATTERMVFVHQRGLFSRFVTDIALGDIRDVRFERNGIFDGLFKLGTVLVRQKDSDTEVRFTRLSHPQEFLAIIQEARYPRASDSKESPDETPSVESVLVLVRSLSREDQKRVCEAVTEQARPSEHELLPVVKKDVGDSTE